MSRSPDQNRRRELLKTLERIMLQEGFSDWRIGTLASRLKCSRSTIYALAPRKEELVFQLVNNVRLEARLAAGVESAKQESPADAITAYLDVMREVTDRGSQRFWDDVAADPAVSRLFGDEEDWGVLVLKNYVENGIASGLFRPVNADFVARLIWHSGPYTRDPAVLREAGLSAGEALGELKQLFLHGIVAT